MLSEKKLNRDFFNQHCCIVAQNLLGQILVFGNARGIITETESYRGVDDPASHAHRGVTPRSKIMFGPPGFSYVYLIYGMYNCLNIITEEEGSPSAVLIRSLQLIEPEAKNLNGPGKLCKYLGINRSHNNIDITEQQDFYILKTISVKAFDSTPRIGIKSGLDKPWRYLITP